MLVFLAFPTPCTTWVLPQINTSHEVFQKDSATPTTTTITTTPSSSNSNTTTSSSSRISPAVLFIIVILAVIFFISGLLHLLLRFLIKKKNPSSSSSPSSSPPNPQNHGSPNSDAIQRQLQQLFHLHDSGLDQAFIDALPVFLYLEIVGSKEPFDCAVCLCEFSQEDKLRLLPVCGHAFHLTCIDTWLLSNSTCPLCRGALFLPGGATDNPMYDFEEEVRLEEGCVGVVPVRLGKFRSTSNRNAGCEIDGDRNGSSIIGREEGESSSSKLDARRCYSMGSFQYVVGDADLRVALSIRDANGRRIREGGGEYEEGKRIGVRSKGESFSVSKIWLWGNKKDKYRVSVDTSSLDGGLPWMARRSVEDSS